MARLHPSLQQLLDRSENERRLGPFSLVEQLGRGGSAPVWLAREVYGATELRTAAVKLFALGSGAAQPGGATRAPALTDGTDRGRRDRIVEEARALCRVEHPHVVRFYSLPMDEALGVMGLAMEHVAGAPLALRIAARGRLSVAETLDVGIAVASALSAVHLAGLVHRDVKPSNIVEAAGVYKLIDFGIAAADAPEPGAAEGSPGEPDSSVAVSATAPGRDTTPPVSTPGRAADSTARLARPCGTPGYIDPACLAGGEAVPASDLYGLGATLHQCLTGLVPRPDEPLAPLLHLVPDAPVALARVVDALTSTERRDRPASAEWVAARLEQIRDEIAGAPRALPPESTGPFRGLGRFEERDRDVYFGRRAEVAAVLSTLRARSVVALVGPSGFGKSSLARAGTWLPPSDVAVPDRT